MPEGKPDKNVFDIQQGVAIIIGVKKKDGGDGLAEVFHGDLWGDRAGKYHALEGGKIEKMLTHLDAPSPQHAFVRRNFKMLGQYEQGFPVRNFFLEKSVGIVTARDKLTIKETKDQIISVVQDFQESADIEGLRARHGLKKDVQDWSVESAKNDLLPHDPDSIVTKIAYRPFDIRWTAFTGVSGGFICRPRVSLMRHLLEHENVAMTISGQQKTPNGFHHILAHSIISESSLTSNKTSEIGSAFPLYLYPDEQDLDQTRRINFAPKLWKKLQKKAKHPTHGTPDEVQTFDYIYGVLHCPAYRETYAEFLKIDFPRIPWPATPDEFWDISAKGSELRKLHLMQPAAIGKAPYQFKGEGDGTVEKPEFKDGKVWINKTQYFDAAPPVSWDFYIGGYQPAQKWLKDRKGRELSFEDVKHYQSILKILSETDRIMQTITMDLD